MNTNQFNSIDSEQMQALVLLMDNELRELVHSEIAPCSDSDFLKRYIELHQEKFNEEFPPQSY